MSVGFELLQAGGTSAERWRTLVDALPPMRRDIHFLPEYGLIHKDAYQHEPLLAVLSHDQGFVIQPLVRRPLRELPFLAGELDRDQFSDVANPYGFGGPVCNNLDPVPAREIYARFAERLAKWFQSEGIASEFCCLHPFLVDHQRSMINGTIDASYEKDVVFIDLRGETDPAASLNRGNRANVHKASRAKVLVERVETTPSNLALFDRLYRETMIRRKAEARWFVPETYFASCCQRLSDRRASLFFARIGDLVECAYLLVHAFSTVYYHFAGTRATRPELKASNLTMLETARWARNAGFSRYHLGGGVTSGANDSLLRFKAGFSKDRARLYTYFQVRNGDIYKTLSARKRAYEIKENGKESTSAFLPLYRRG